MRNQGPHKAHLLSQFFLQPGAPISGMLEAAVAVRTMLSPCRAWENREYPSQFGDHLGNGDL